MPSSRAPHCPRCNGLTRVTNTFYEKGSERRDDQSQRSTIRERLCLNCSHKFITRQKPERVLPAMTIQWPSDLGNSNKLVTVIPRHRLMKTNRLVKAKS